VAADEPAALSRIQERAAAETRALRHGYIGSEHLLLALLGVSGTHAARRLEEAGARYDEVRARIVRIVGLGDEQIADDEILPYTSNAVAVTQRVRRESQRSGPQAIGTEHILRAVLRRRGALAVPVLEDCGIDASALADELRRARPDEA